MLPLVLQLPALSDEKDDPPDVLDAKDESFFFTFLLPHVGQTTLSVEKLRTSFSNGLPQLSQSNSKIGTNDS